VPVKLWMKVMLVITAKIEAVIMGTSVHTACLPCLACLPCCDCFSKLLFLKQITSLRYPWQIFVVGSIQGTMLAYSRCIFTWGHCDKLIDIKRKNIFLKVCYVPATSTTFLPFFLAVAINSANETNKARGTCH